MQDKLHTPSASSSASVWQRLRKVLGVHDAAGASARERATSSRGSDAVAVTRSTGGVTPATRVMSAYRPLFFSDLVAFNTETHRHLTLPVPSQHYPFAASAYFLPLTISEVLTAVLYYPLVFVPEGDILNLMMLTGVPQTGNRFVDADGHWRENTYVPAYVRGYPFITLQTAVDAQPIIAFDPNAAEFKAPDGERLMDDHGEPSERFKSIIAFHSEYRVQTERTRRITQALLDADVLEASHLNVRNAAGVEEPQLDGFLVVNETRLHALSAEALKRLSDAGALGLAHRQIVSMGNLHRIQPPALASGGASAVSPALASQSL